MVANADNRTELLPAVTFHGDEELIGDVTFHGDEELIGDVTFHSLSQCFDGA